MSVHCLPDGRWFVKHRQDGKWKREYYGRGAEGERSATARNLQLGLGAPATSGPSVRELAQRYLQARMGSMAESSRKDTAWKLEGVLLPAFGDLPAAALSPSCWTGTSPTGLRWVENEPLSTGNCPSCGPSSAGP